MAYCGKCLHLDVCKTTDSCDGHVPGCKYFLDKESFSACFGLAPWTCQLGAKGCYPDGGCRSTKACKHKVFTHADQTRSMTDEQLADALYKVYCELGNGGPKDLSSLLYDGKAGCVTKNGNIRCSEKKYEPVFCVGSGSRWRCRRNRKMINEPICLQCDHCKLEKIYFGNRAKRYCTHRYWDGIRALKMRWIPSKDRGKTSPMWCPRRKKEIGDGK